MNRIFVIINVLVTISVTNVVSAADESRSFILASHCMSCHGPNGKSPGVVPSINAKEASYLKKKMYAFRNGLEESTIMNRLAKGYTEEEIDIITEYFAEISRKE